MAATPDDVRAIALALPEATERPAWDMACLRVRDKVFASMPPREDWVAVRLAPGENTGLAAERPDVFSVPHHYRNSTMVVVRLAAVDRAELAELLTEAWRLRAPVRLRAAFDTAAPGVSRRSGGPGAATPSGLSVPSGRIDHDGGSGEDAR
ncbi:MmcQ/YjbR family DNA-binding protein [Modestobacter sp. URMC 112]